MAKYRIRYLHGYPSVIYDFACYCEEGRPAWVAALRSMLRGAFPGSEFPHPVYRDKIESVFGIPSVSWYGYTERTILAWEAGDRYCYVPFHTYGFAEAVQNPSTGRMTLVGTSYYSNASPFIRYDTGDEVEVVASEGGLLRAFRITGGRQGDYVIDRSGKRISLTGLVFGRHHKIFGKARFVQVTQNQPGKVVFVITPKSQLLSGDLLRSDFDLAGIDMEFACLVVDSPILSPMGKVLLKVDADLLPSATVLPLY